MTFRMNIKPGEFAEFPFVVINPKASRIEWRAIMHRADGTTEAFVGEPGSALPSPVTLLRPAD